MPETQSLYFITRHSSLRNHIHRFLQMRFKIRILFRHATQLKGKHTLFSFSLLTGIYPPYRRAVFQIGVIGIERYFGRRETLVIIFRNSEYVTGLTVPNRYFIRFIPDKSLTVILHISACVRFLTLRPVILYPSPCRISMRLLLRSILPAFNYIFLTRNQGGCSQQPEPQ